ncbi:hypothetical protein [Glutamicibacter endophyticus]|uniref:hypothetical protein n=1 Tax=Glutamicibacter endophyticus TaxID=1522174 RepID=UPI003AF02A88
MQDPELAAANLAAFVDGYAASADFRTQLPPVMAERAEAVYRLLHDERRKGKEPLGTMFTQGHVEHWRKAADYVRTYQSDSVCAIA